MTGLEKILAQIADDSAAKCEAVIQSAKEEAGLIVNEAKSKANEEGKKIVEDAREQADRIISSAKTSAEAYTRTKYLEVRNAIVNDVIAAAFEDIEKLADDKYFDLLFRLCKKYLEPGECVMKLSQRDILRIPADFEMKLNGEFFETSAIEVSKEPANISSGFILVYPEFEINCSIKSLFEENMDTLKDTLCGILFS